MMTTRKRKTATVDPKDDKEEDKLENLAKAAEKDETEIRETARKRRMLLSSIQEGVDDDQKEEDEALKAKGKQPKQRHVLLQTRNNKTVQLARTPRIHRLSKEQQLKRVMGVINTLVAADVVPNTKNIKAMGIGAGYEFP